MCCLTIVFFAGFVLLSRLGGPIYPTLARACFLIIFLRALNGVRVHFPALSTGQLRALFGRAGFFVLGLALLGTLIFLVVRYGWESVTRKLAIVTLILFPFGLLGMVQGTWLAIRYGRNWNEPKPAPMLPAKSNLQPRVLWLIFDELSEEVAFASRPKNFSLPNFDRLRAESLLATNAFPPAAHTTQSIPALLTGRLIEYQARRPRSVAAEIS